MRSQRVILIFILMLMNSLVHAGFDFSKCKKDRQKGLRTSFKDLEEGSEKKDVTSRFNLLTKSVKANCPEAVQKDIFPIMRAMKKEGHYNALHEHARSAKHVANYRAPTEELNFYSYQLKKFREMGGKIRFRPPLTSYDRERLTKQGQAESAKRRRSCKPKDNRKPPLVDFVRKGRNNNNNRSQDSIGWCYAFTAADMISHKIGQVVSAVDVANAYNDSGWDYFFGVDESKMSGGYTAEAANKALKRGLCLEKNLPSEDFKYSRVGGNVVKGLREVEKMYEAYRKLAYKTTPSQPIYSSVGVMSSMPMSFRKQGGELMHAERVFMNKYVCSGSTLPWNALFPTLKDHQVLTLIRKSNSDNDFVDGLVNLSCKPRFKAPGLKFTQRTTSVFNGGLKGMVNKLNEVLDGGDIVGINYFSSVLKNRHNRRDGHHASSIVARRFNEKSGTCEYLLRNSWGTGCYSYDRHYKCEQGNIWIGEEFLTDASTSITYAE